MGIKRGDAVEVLMIWAYNTEPSWLRGYRYYDQGTVGVVVEKVGGALDGSLSLHAPDRVRPERVRDLLLGVDMLAVGAAYREHCRRGQRDYRGWP